MFEYRSDIKMNNLNEFLARAAIVLVFIASAYAEISTHRSTLKNDAALQRNSTDIAIEEGRRRHHLFGHHGFSPFHMLCKFSLAASSGRDGTL